MKKSYFDGTVLQHFGYSLLAGMFTAITFGIGAPWAYCGLHRWEIKHTVIDSRRLEFDGKGLQLLLLALKLFFLPILIFICAALIYRPFVETDIGPLISILTGLALLILSIFYGSFVVIQFSKWAVSHTHFSTQILSSDTEDDHHSVHSDQSAPTYTPQSVSAPDPRATPWEAHGKDWVDKIAPALPLVYVLWFCGIAAAVFLVLKLIFK